MSTRRHKYPIESGIPIPTTAEALAVSNQERARHIDYQFDVMKPGDSVRIDCTPSERQGIRRNVLSSAAARGYRITTRTVAGGVRYWMKGERVE